MASSEQKSQFAADYTEEFDTHERAAQKNATTFRVLESVRQGLTVLTLLFGLSIVGMTGDLLSVYNRTNAGDAGILSLWPVAIDVGPDVALLTGASVIVFTNIISITFSKVPSIRARHLVHSTASILTPAITLILAIVSVAFFYAINASTTTESIQSWSCRWENIDMPVEPHFDALCKESETSLYMSIIMIPLQLIVLSLAAAGIIAAKKVLDMDVEELGQRKASPALS